jgi:uncharacterized protein
MMFEAIVEIEFVMPEVRAITARSAGVDSCRACPRHEKNGQTSIYAPLQRVVGQVFKATRRVFIFPTVEDATMDDKTRTELEAAVYRRLVEHLRSRTDVQNIDLMNLAGFCRNCLSNWMKEAADAQGVSMSKDESREVVYGMPYDEWRKKYQKEASSEQKAAFEKSRSGH